MNNNDVAHAFSRDPFSQGSGSNFFFEGGKIYSYGHHFCIAKVLSDTYPRVALMSTQGYSSSTARHMSRVRSAISHWDLVYVNDANGDWIDNLQCFVHDLEQQISALVNSRTQLQKERASAGLVEVDRNLVRYLDLLKQMKIKVTVKGQSRIEHKDTVRKVLKIRKLIDSGEMGVAKLEKGLATAERAGKRAQKAADKKTYARELEAISRWYTGERRHIYELRTHALPEYYEKERGMKRQEFDLKPNALLRVSEDGKKLETSKAYNMELGAAHIIYKKLQKGKALGIDVDGWNVSTVTDDVIVIGCHTVPMVEIERIAEELQWK